MEKGMHKMSGSGMMMSDKEMKKMMYDKKKKMMMKKKGKGTKPTPFDNL